MMTAFARILFVGLAFAGSAANAQGDAPIVPAQVTAVATGGEWRSPSGTGELRVLIVNQGYEHVHSKLWLEWLSVGERGQRRVAARVLVKALSNGFAVLSLGDSGKTFDGARVQLRATNPYSMEEKGVTIEAGRPGQYKVIF